MDLTEKPRLAFINLPGIHGSGEQHWQTIWEKTDNRFSRFKPSDWDKPRLVDWTLALDDAIDNSSKRVILVAHSLGCLLVPHWASTSIRKIAGAFLVSVPDSTGANFPAEAKSFSRPPDKRLPFPTMLLASSDDPYSSMDHAKACASAWGSQLVEMGPLGHINAASGLKDWPDGLKLLTSLCADLNSKTHPTQM